MVHVIIVPCYNASMEHANTYGEKHAAMQQLLRAITYLLVFLMPFSVFITFGLPANRQVNVLFAQRGFYLSDVPLILLLLLTLIGDVPWRRGPLLVTVPLIGIIALAFLSIPRSISPAFTFYVAVRWLLALYLYFWFLQPVVRIKGLAMTLGIGLALHALVGIGQVVLQQPLNLPGELALPSQVSGAAVTLVDGARWLRPYGLTFHPNVLGGFLTAGLLLLTPWLRRLPTIVLWWLLWFALLLTISRAAWLATALTLPLALVIFYLKYPKIRWKLALAIGGAIVILLLFLTLFGDQVAARITPLTNAVSEIPGSLPTTPLEQTSISERVALTELAWEIIVERPLQGIGAGNFPLTMPQRRPLMIAQYVHNIPLLLAAEVGVLGALCWFIAGIAVSLRLILNWTKVSPWLVSSAIAWLALLIIASFDSYPWSLTSGMQLTIMILGIASRAPRDAR